MSLHKITKGMRVGWERKQAKGCTSGHLIFGGQAYEEESAKEIEKERPEKWEENQESMVLKIKEEDLRSELGTGLPKVDVIGHLDTSVEGGMNTPAWNEFMR